MKLSRVGIDLAKNVYQLHGVDRSGKTVWKRRLKRHQWFKALLDNTEPGCVIGIHHRNLEDIAPSQLAPERGHRCSPDCRG